MRASRHLLLVPVLALVLAAPARAGNGPILHERIPPDPHEDLALEVALDGDLPVAIDTKSGLVTAPDPRRPVAPTDTPYDSAAGERGDRNDATFTPDRNTKRPDVQGYDEPFTPSTAPFKRLEAFDEVSETYELRVRDRRLAPVLLGATPSADGSEEQFYADMVVDVGPGRRVRIPSVGPSARIVRARLGIGAQDLPLKIWRDGAENWFAESTATGRARLVMELTIPRSVFGGEFFDTAWADLPRVAPLPERVQRAAQEVKSALGVGPQLRPRENVNKLVTWFRSFVDSEEPPRGRGDIYLDLALSKKGVCRHRAFAFLITAQSLGIPTRMVINEAHAWIEVHDGVAWRRIDLGGAGRMVNPASSTVPERPVYQPPPDAFSWPQGSERGDDMVEQARERARQQQSGPGRSGPLGDGGASTSPSAAPTGSGEPLMSGSVDGGASPPASPMGSGASSAPGSDKDDRPPAALTVNPTDADAHRGMPLHVRGDVRADGDACGHVVVELYLRDVHDARRLLLLGAVATGEDGTYASAIVVPGTTPLGDYDVVARTQGDARCGRGTTP